jgi:hypothetical protein
VPEWIQDEIAAGVTLESTSLAAGATNPEYVDCRHKVRLRAGIRTGSDTRAEASTHKRGWAMWIVFSIFLVLWILSVEFVMPVALTITFFAFVVGAAAVALMPNRDEEMEYDRE